jgi:hypothetical protein
MVGVVLARPLDEPIPERDIVQGANKTRIHPCARLAGLVAEPQATWRSMENEARKQSKALCRCQTHQQER